MASSPHDEALLARALRGRPPRRCARLCALAALLLGGCSIGQGQGEIGGAVQALDCDVDESDYELSPSFYTAEVTGGQINVRVQRGSDLEGYGDGLGILVRDVDEVKQQRIGLPIQIGPEHTSLVQVVVYLNETCLTGFPDEFRRRPLIMEAVGGTITFDAIYAPEIDAGATRIEAELGDVRFEDPEIPEERNATLSGWFSFFYQRGSPAQRFP